ncbi:GlsB/YeaQ/YmgE family stress response membrane protein [Sapientia aquatica]|uniref:GlsB/YeaQ/YmgE family stress response membrane protein n=1 Tax=Sapientia aquatica TaxID=1549640 RepID=A0A4R5W0Q1_9BURK|nr:GlsB/YeaQ/YmgE family stress response membrane protein [Sapientia aquatica]TDK65359.1 GlsB/YeaQ/YmgE family stress response membrane protein [Sapientia aquatica]
MHIIWTILIGLIAGVIAKFILPGNNPGGFILTSLLGIAGSVVATYLGHFVGWYQAGESAGFIGAVVGAIVLLGLYHLATKNS